jgi:glycosyltransferase involved in cell wall biosynthesis
MPARPAVTIGVPVYNGANYLSDVLGSIARQTFQDYCVIISDNASTDATPEIARRAMAADPRIAYRRNPVNIGGNCNFDKVFEYCTTPYFVWIGHDDMIAPEFLATCLETLESSPDVVQSACRTLYIDPEGKPTPINPATGCYEAPFLVTPHPVEREHLAESDDPVERWKDFFPWYSRSSIHGLMRTEVVRRTGMLGPRFNGPNLFLCELALRGRFHLSEKPLLLRRFHPSSSEALPMEERVQYVIAGERRIRRRLLENSRSFVEGILRTETLTLAQKARLIGIVAEHTLRTSGERLMQRAIARLAETAGRLQRAG